jgi:hypothetical protein
MFGRSTAIRVPGTRCGMTPQASGGGCGNDAGRPAALRQRCLEHSAQCTDLTRNAATGTNLAKPERTNACMSARPEDFMKYGLLWLLGVPIPVLIVIYLMFHH